MDCRVISTFTRVFRRAMPGNDGDTSGHLEKLLSPPIADSPRVNVHESEREQSGISRRQFCGVRRLAAIFRGAPMAFLLDTNILSDLVRRPRVGLLITFANRGIAHLYEH